MMCSENFNRNIRRVTITKGRTACNSTYKTGAHNTLRQKS